MLTVNGSMAVRTYRNQVVYWINHIVFTDLVQRNQMMHLNHIFEFRTVRLFKTHATNLAGISMIGKARRAGARCCYCTPDRSHGGPARSDNLPGSHPHDRADEYFRYGCG